MKKRAFSDQYDDIIGLEHHVSPVRKQMSALERAAQFSPFAALTGHQDALAETQRLTEAHAELEEDCRLLLNQKLQILSENLSRKPEITVTYFQRDERKAGGRSQTCSGIVKKIDEMAQLLLMSDGTRIPMEHLYEIDGEIFNKNFIS